MLIIGIPVSNDLRSFQETIMSLRNSTNRDNYDKIIIIESESTDGTKEYCDLLVKIDDKIEVIHTQKEGPLKAYNKLFDLAKERKSDLFLTQSDVIFPRMLVRDWLTEMKQIALSEEIGAITTLNGTGVSGPDYVDGFKWLGGWATYYPLRTIELIGGYDEFFPNGMGVDIDHTYRLIKEGLKIIYINYWVDHHMMNSREHDYNQNAEEHKRASAEHFRRKYGLDR